MRTRSINVWLNIVYCRGCEAFYCIRSTNHKFYAVNIFIQQKVVLTLAYKSIFILYCVSGWIYTFGGSTYYLSKDIRLTLTWTEARVWCRIMGEHSDLVKIETEEEDRYLRGKNGNRNTWIGATDVNEEGTFRWTDGSLLTYSNWAPNEPSDGEENCAHYYDRYNGKWNDKECLSQSYFICERKNDAWKSCIMEELTIIQYLDYLIYNQVLKSISGSCRTHCFSAVIYSTISFFIVH